MNRARAKRLFLAWERYMRRYPPARVRIGSTHSKWWNRARRHRTTHAGIQAHREGRAL